MMLRAAPDTLDLAAVHEQFFTLGYARLGVWADESTLLALRTRLDDIQSGRRDHTPFFFQKDAAEGRYDRLTYGKGWEGPSPDYRKIEKLERDDLFAAWLRNPLFERVARSFISGPITIIPPTAFSPA